MKKSVVLIISLIYIIAVVVVSLIGVKIKGVDEKIYVDHITISDPDNGARMTELDPSLVDEDYYFTTTYQEGLVVRVKAQVYPENSSWPNVTYFYDTENTIFSIEQGESNIANIYFLKRGTAIFTVESTDGNKIQTTVRIRATRN